MGGHSTQRWPHHGSGRRHLRVRRGSARVREGASRHGKSANSDGCASRRVSVMTVDGKPTATARSLPTTCKVLCAVYGLIAVAALAATWSQTAAYVHGSGPADGGPNRLPEPRSGLSGHAR